MANAAKVFEFKPNETAANIQASLDAYMSGKTVINVAHHSVRGMIVYTVFTS